MLKFIIRISLYFVSFFAVCFIYFGEGFEKAILYILTLIFVEIIMTNFKD